MAQAIHENPRVIDIGKDIDLIWRQYKGGLEGADIEQWLAIWTDDCVQMPNGTHQRVGKASLEEGVRETFRNLVISDVHIRTEEVHVCGDFAFARGQYGTTLTPRAGGEARKIDGKFLTVFARQPDGSWKMHRDIFNSNVPR